MKGAAILDQKFINRILPVCEKQALCWRYRSSLAAEFSAPSTYFHGGYVHIMLEGRLYKPWHS